MWLERMVLCCYAGLLFNAAEDGAYDASGYAALDGFITGGRHVLLELVGELGDGEGLEPDAAGGR